MVELLVLGALGVAGLALLFVSGLLSRHPVLSGWLAVPTGIAAYGLLALLEVGVTKVLHPVAVLIATVLGSMAVAFARRVEFRARHVATAAGALAIVLVVAGTAALFNATRLTPDSVWYLLAARNLELGGPPWTMIVRELPKRQFLYPALLAVPSAPAAYLEMLGPAVLASVTLFSAALVWLVGERRSPRVRMASAMIPLVFLLASNRFLFHGFYLNSHMLVAAFTLIGAAGIWRGLVSDPNGWGAPVALACSSLVLLRPETPFVALVIVFLLSLTGRRAHLWMAIAATGLATGVWYVAILWPYAPGGSELGLDEPVFGTIIAAAGILILSAAAGPWLARRIGRRASHAGLLGFGTLLVLFALRDPELGREALVVSGQNLFGGDGLWGATWWAVIIGYLLTVSLDPSLWPLRRTFEAFLVLHLLSAYMRGSPWRLGPGDSGSRIIAHILPVVVVTIVAAAISGGEEKPVVQDPA